MDQWDGSHRRDRRSDKSFDLPGGAIAAGGASILTFGDASGERTVQATISGTDPSGFTLVTPDLLAAGMWGGDCQLKVTRNEAAGIAGEFSCPTITGGNPSGDRNRSGEHQRKVLGNPLSARSAELTVRLEQAAPTRAG